MGVAVIVVASTADKTRYQSDVGKTARGCDSRRPKGPINLPTLRPCPTFFESFQIKVSPKFEAFLRTQKARMQKSGQKNMEILGLSFLKWKLTVKFVTQ